MNVKFIFKFHLIINEFRGAEVNVNNAREQIVIIVTQENAMLLSGRSQNAPPLPPTGPTPAQRARLHALNIDRFSRVFFPFLFTALNVAYWITFAEYI